MKLKIAMINTKLKEISYLAFGMQLFQNNYRQWW